MNEYAILRITATGNEPIVQSWHETAGEAIGEASSLNDLNDGQAYRAVSTTADGKFQSLTGDSLYV